MYKKVALLLVFCLMLVVPAFANEAPEKTAIQVSGSSQKEVTPDIAYMDIAIHSTNENLEQAKNENAQAANQLFAKLREQDVADEQIKTDTYSIDPIYSYPKDRLPVLKGYQVVNRLEITAPIERVGLLVNAVTEAGANEINSIRFGIINEADAKNQALRDAVLNALNKAEVIAAALNKKVAGVKLINESGVFYRPLMMESMKAGRMDASVPSIPSGKVTVGANVQVTVELE